MRKIVVVTNVLTHYQINFFNRLVELGDDIELTIFADIDAKSNLNHYNEIECNFRVINSTGVNIKGLIFRKSILKDIYKISPNSLIFYGNPREVTLTMNMLYYAITGRDFYVHGMFHRIGGERISSKIYYRLIGKISKKCLTYSRKGANILVNLGVSSEKITVIGTAIDERKSLYYDSIIDKDKLIKFKKINNIVNKKVILQVVRLSKQKNPDAILHVAKKISESRSDIVFIIIGGGDLYNEINDKIKELGLDNIVRLLGPIYDESVLSYWFKTAEVLVIPTCIGLSAHHAFSYSLPVITDDNILTQASEFDILSDGLNALLYESKNIDSLEEKILEIVDNKKLQSFLSKNALYTVKHIYNLDNKCHSYLKAIS